MNVRRMLTAGAAAVGLTGLAGRFVPGASRFASSAEPGRFPSVSGFNLDRQEVRFPRDLSRDYTLLFVAFRQWQQQVVDTWIRPVKALEAEREDLAYYELPTIFRMPAMGRLWVNEGMRAGIPDPVARARTVTLYLDLDAFTRALQIPDRDQVYTFLLDRQGHILWRTTGPYTPEQGHLLSSMLGDRAQS